jgi:hypothetical protein
MLPQTAAIINIGTCTVIFIGICIAELFFPLLVDLYSEGSVLYRYCYGQKGGVGHAVYPGRQSHGVWEENLVAGTGLCASHESWVSFSRFLALVITSPLADLL